MREQNRQINIRVNAGVHANHCCNEHGCKYMEADCPVVLGTVIQHRPCIDCDEAMQKHFSSKAVTKKFEAPDRDAEYLRTVKFGDPNLEEKTAELLREQNMSERSPHDMHTDDVQCDSNCANLKALMENGEIFFKCIKYDIYTTSNKNVKSCIFEKAEDNFKDPNDQEVLPDRLLVEFYKEDEPIPMQYNLDNFTINYVDKILELYLVDNKLHIIVELLRDIMAEAKIEFRAQIKTNNVSSAIPFSILNLIAYSKVQDLHKITLKFV